MNPTCPLCPHHCACAEGQTGLCGARANVGGTIQSINYGRVTAIALDPIEKKPLNRFHPGSYILSVGSFGCNMRCPYCQNSDISTADRSISTEEISPRALVEKALLLKPRGNIGIAFTYNEPLVGYEYVLDSAKLAQQAGLATVLVTNGMICEEPLGALLPYIDALNIDLKGFSQSVYEQLGGDFQTVCACIQRAVRASHVEITTLIVPGLNEDAAAMEAEAQWLSEIDPELPLHISRFFPRHHMCDRPPTKTDTLHAYVQIAQRYLRHVYTGNC